MRYGERLQGIDGFDSRKLDKAALELALRPLESLSGNLRHGCDFDEQVWIVQANYLHRSGDWKRFAEKLTSDVPGLHELLDVSDEVGQGKNVSHHTSDSRQNVLYVLKRLASLCGHVALPHDSATLIKINLAFQVDDLALASDHARREWAERLPY